MYNIILAMAIICGLKPPADVVYNTELVLNLRCMAIEMQLVDYRESVFYLTPNYEHYFLDEVHMVQMRYEDLKDSPEVGDAERFPEYMVAENNLILHRQMFGWGNYGKEYKTWDTLLNAKNEACFVIYRRQALTQLRKLIGEEAYYSGRMPPAIPMHLLKEVD